MVRLDSQIGQILSYADGEEHNYKDDNWISIHPFIIGLGH